MEDFPEGRRDEGKGKLLLANECPYAGRFGRHHGLATARHPRHQAKTMLADPTIGDRIARKADGGRRPQSIQGISA